MDLVMLALQSGDSMNLFSAPVDARAKIRRLVKI